jgi:hypothetical protein
MIKTTDSYARIESKDSKRKNGSNNRRCDRFKIKKTVTIATFCSLFLYDLNMRSLVSRAIAQYPKINWLIEKG